MKHIQLFDEFINEAIDTKYWADYNTDTSGLASKSWSTKSKDFEETFETAIVEWNRDAEDIIKGTQIQKIRKLAEEFFKKEKWISVNVIQAMIAQES